ncbi:MAG TPA: hypothetical protein DIU15_07365, partial [Deltaproteobacteria bacterium]|nr:hypothetical protein [Deltaproteobacteria bacterium]
MPLARTRPSRFLSLGHGLALGVIVALVTVASPRTVVAQISLPAMERDGLEIPLARDPGASLRVDLESREAGFLQRL